MYNNYPFSVNMIFYLYNVYILHVRFFVIFRLLKPYKTVEGGR